MSDEAETLRTRFYAKRRNLYPTNSEADVFDTALESLERERAAGEAIFVELFQVAIETHGRLVDRNEVLQDEVEHLKRHHEQYHPGPCITQDTDPDECPTCRSRTRSFRDKLWHEGFELWIECRNPWHEDIG